MRQWSTLIGALVALCLALPVGAAETLKGIALVIGESSYSTLPKLDNPKRDARAIDDMLDSLGFTVDRVLDGDAEKLRRALADFVDEAKTADVALVYYSGHGVEIGGANYLVPTDTRFDSPDIAGQSLVAVEPLLDELAKVVPVTVVLLDACRTDAFPPGTLIQPPGASNALAPAPAGLQEIRGPTPVARQGVPPTSLGMVIGFAASPGQPALDGPPGENSPYAAALLKHFAAGGYSLGDVMTMVSEEVYLATRAKQLPWVNASLRRVLTFGAAPEQADPDTAAIQDGRRQLLLTIATEPPARRAYVEKVAQSENVPLDALYGMLKVLGVSSSDDLDSELKAGAARLKELLSTTRTGEAKSDSELARLSGLADTAEQEGVIDLALKYREQATARATVLEGEVDAAEANLKSDRLQLGETYAEHARTASLNFDFATAAQMWGRAFAQVEKWDPDLAIEYQWRKAASELALGQAHADREALETAIASYDAAAKRAAGTPLQVRVQSDQAIALQKLGSLTGDTSILDRSIDVFLKTLKHFPREEAPIEWGHVQTNLGNSYQMRGDLTDDREDYRRSAAAHRLALETLTRDNVPFDWAIVEDNLGIALARLGETEEGTDSLNEAISAFDSALQVLSRDTLPQDWARSQNNLGGALATLGNRIGNTEAMTDAIAAFESALTVSTREKTPADYGQTVRNIGITARSLGAMTGDISWYDRAIASYREAMTVFDRERHAVDWGMLQGAIGIAALARADLSDQRVDLETARDAFAAANQILGVNDQSYADYFAGKIADIDARLGG